MEDDSSERILKQRGSVQTEYSNQEVEDDSSERILKRIERILDASRHSEVEDDSSERILKPNLTTRSIGFDSRSGRRFFRENTETSHNR